MMNDVPAGGKERWESESMIGFGPTTGPGSASDEGQSYYP
jgi:hypothetical protein